MGDLARKLIIYPLILIFMGCSFTPKFKNNSHKITVFDEFTKLSIEEKLRYTAFSIEKILAQKGFYVKDGHVEPYVEFQINENSWIKNPRFGVEDIKFNMWELNFSEIYFEFQCEY
ncbi:hypothetical protein K9L16_02190 [Candidatus Pacearchaeota archaeon]|nr:hypothetical protein [Candidatus Pacearchaeota archaeon]